MRVRIAVWSAHHPWRAVGAWVLLVAVSYLGGAAVGTHEATSADLGSGQSGRAAQIIASGDFDRTPPSESVLITARTGPLQTLLAEAAVADLRESLTALPQVTGVGEPVSAPSGDAVLVPVIMAGDVRGAADRVQPLLEATARVQATHPDLRVEQVGAASIGAALEQTLGADFHRAEILSVPITSGSWWWSSVL